MLQSSDLEITLLRTVCTCTKLTAITIGDQWLYFQHFEWFESVFSMFEVIFSDWGNFIAIYLILQCFSGNWMYILNFDCWSLNNFNYFSCLSMSIEWSAIKIQNIHSISTKTLQNQVNCINHSKWLQTCQTRIQTTQNAENPATDPL